MIDAYKFRMAALGGYDGEAKRRNAQKIMDASWMRDVATKPVYVKWVDRGLPVVNDDDEVLYAKYNVKSYHNITGDEIGYLLEFRLEDMKNRPDIKVGSYVSIPNEMDEYEWWLIWHYDDRLQFRQFSIVKCLHEYTWVSIKDGMRVIHHTLGCPRNQSSYNSGVWLDYTTQVVENQHILVMPTNEDSKTIGYDTRFLISEPGRYPPIAWKISKIAPSLGGEITRFTMTQEQFDPARDNAELMIGGYNEYKVSPDYVEVTDGSTISNFEITYSGNPAVRAGGGFKKLTLKSLSNEQLVNVTDKIEWSINGVVLTSNSDKEQQVVLSGNPEALKCIVKGNELKVKCTSDYSLIGDTFTVTATVTVDETEQQNTKSLLMEVISL